MEINDKTVFGKRNYCLTENDREFRVHPTLVDYRKASSTRGVRNRSKNICFDCYRMSIGFNELVKLIGPTIVKENTTTIYRMPFVVHGNFVRTLARDLPSAPYLYVRRLARRLRPRCTFSSPCQMRTVVLIDKRPKRTSFIRRRRQRGRANTRVLSF